MIFQAPGCKKTRFAAAFRRFLRRIGWHVSLSDNDIRDILRRSRNAMRKRTAGVPGGNIVNNTEKAYSSTGKENLSVGTDENGSVRSGTEQNGVRFAAAALRRDTDPNNAEGKGLLRDSNVPHADGFMERAGLEGTRLYADYEFLYGRHSKYFKDPEHARAAVELVLSNPEKVQDIAGNLSFAGRDVETGEIYRIEIEPKVKQKFNHIRSVFEITPEQYDRIKLSESPVLQLSPTEHNAAGRTLNSFVRYDSAENTDVKPDSENNLRFSVSPAEDRAYLDAVKNGDMETAQKMVEEAARRAGYSEKSDYQGSLAFNGAAPSKNAYFETKEERKAAWEAGDYEGDFSLGDYIDNGIDTHDLDWRINDPAAKYNEPKNVVEAINNLRNTVKNGKRTIKIYRAVDAAIKENQIRNGDWVTPSRSYAEYHITLQDWKSGRIIEQEVSVDDIWWNGDDIAEWGYDDGKSYAYSNTPNNRKLLDAVTYDDNGEAIPLSERFKKDNPDIRFSIAPPVESKAFKEWFGNSKAVDAEGKPLVVYHGTEHHFTVFSRTADWGYHFGTKTAAEKRLKNINAGEYGRIIPAYLRLENPLYLPDLQDWSPVEVARILVRKKYLTQQEVEENYLDSSLWDIRQYLIQKGYDGVVYKNRHEDRGSVSYTVFSPEQIKSADAVTYDDNGEAIPLSERFKKDNPDIRFSISPVMEIAVEYEETPTDYSNVEEFERKHAAALADTLNAGDAYDNSFSENFDEEWAAYSEEERIAVINQRYEEDIAEAKEDYEREKAANESFDRYDAFATAFEKIRDAVSPVAEEAGFEVTSKSNSAGNSFYIKLDNDEDLYTLRFSDHKQPANGSYRIRETEWGTDARRESADLDIVLQNGKFDLAPVFRFIQEKSQNNPDIRFSYPGLREMSEEDFAANPKVEAWAKVMMPEVSKGLAASDIDAAERFLTENGIDIDHVRDGALVRQAWLLAGSMYRQYRTKRNGFEAMEFYRSSHPLFDYIANFASSPDWKINPGSKYRGSEFSGTFLSPEFRKNSGALKQRKNESNADFARRQRQQTEKLDNASGIRLDEVATAYANEYGLDAISVEKEIMDLLGTLTRRDILSEYSRFKRESAFADRELERRYAEEWMLSENARIENEAAALLENAGNIEITPEWIDNNRPVYKVLYNMLFDKTAPYSPSKSDMAAINAAMRLANAPDAASDVAENTRTFNEQLQNQIDGTLPSGHVYQLGMPSAVLRSTGIPDLPIELASSRLAEKAKQQNHPFDISEIKNLPQALQNPVAVFRYGDANKAQNIIVDIQQGNKNFLVGLFLDENHRGISVNDIRGLFPKDTEKWLQWIQDGKALYLDKERIQTMIAQQRTNLAEVSYLDLDSINNIVENFENASQDSRKSAQQIAAAYKAAREQAFNEFREKLRDFKNNLNADRVDAEKLRQEAFALLEDKIPPEYRGERYSPSHI